MRRGSNNTILYVAVGILVLVLASQNGFHLNPTMNGTPVNVPGVELNASTGTATVPVTVTPGIGGDPLGTAQALAQQTALAGGTITATATFLPGETPTVGPSPTLQPLIVQTGDIQATIDLLKKVQFGYQSSEISAGAQVGCGVVEQTSQGVRIPIGGIPFTKYTMGLTPEGSKFSQSVALCVTIKTGWNFSDLQIDWDQSSLGEYETVSETTNEQGQKVIIQKPTANLVITAKRPACVTAVHLGKGQTQIAFTKTPSTTMQALAPLFGVSYVNGMDAQLQKLYEDAYTMAVSRENLMKAREQATYSFTHISTGGGDENGALYNDLQTMIAATGNWASFTLETQVLGDNNAPFIGCSDGTAVP